MDDHVTFPVFIVALVGTHPQQVVLALVIQIHPRPQAGMDERHAGELKRSG